jgi:hypothetical protein
MMALSAVAGIVDSSGGLRVVVTQRERMHHHISKGEKLFIVPGMRVQEPVPWDEIPVVIRKVELYVLWWIETRNDPNQLRNPALRNYLNNPNASHNLRPDEFKQFDLHDLMARAA